MGNPTLAFVLGELKGEIKELRRWAREDRRAAKDNGERDECARLLARADAYLHCADHMERITRGQTAAEALAEKLRG